MNLIFQFSLASLILLSFLLVIAVPYVCSFQNLWNENKNYVLLGSTFWCILVLIVGVLNSFVI